MKLKGRPSRYSKEQIKQIYILFDSGDYGYGTIAKMLNLVSWQAVRYYLKKREKEQEHDSNK